MWRGKAIIDNIKVGFHDCFAKLRTGKPEVIS